MSRFPGVLTARQHHSPGGVPAWPFRVNWSSPLARGLTNLYVFGPGTAFDLVTTRADGVVSNTATITGSHTSRPWTVQRNTANSDGIIVQPTKLRTNETFSMAACCYPTGQGTWAGIMNSRATIELGLNIDPSQRLSAWYGSGHATGTFPDVAFDEWQVLCGEYETPSSSNWNFHRHVVSDSGYLSGVATSVSASGVPNLTDIYIGHDSVVSSWTMTGEVAWAGVWLGRLGVDRVKALWRDNDLFESAARPIWFEPGAAAAFEPAWAVGSTVTLGVGVAA